MRTNAAIRTRWRCVTTARVRRDRCTLQTARCRVGEGTLSSAWASCSPLNRDIVAAAEIAVGLVVRTTAWTWLVIEVAELTALPHRRQPCAMGLPSRDVLARLSSRICEDVVGSICSLSARCRESGERLRSYCSMRSIAGPSDHQRQLLPRVKHGVRRHHVSLEVFVHALRAG